MIRTVYGRSKIGMALIPFANATTVKLFISTRNQNIEVDWGDGSAKQIYITSKNSEAPNDISHTYSSAFTGNVTISNSGMRDVYFFATSAGGTGNMSKLNITDIETFFNQFPNLYSVFISEFPGSTAVIKGDLSRFPDSVEKVLIQYTSVVNSVNDFVLNFSNYRSSSKLKSFTDMQRGDSPTKLIGDLSKLPITCNFFRITVAHTGSSITYTAGKVWASSFDTLSIPLVLTTAELDNLLIDMNNSITTKISAGVIALDGFRSFTSDTAVASLQTKGFTVNVTRNPLNINSYSDSALLRLDFQNNFDVYSNSGLNISAGGTYNQPTFALSGRKAGEYCAVFNGSQSIKTTTNLPINSDKVTIAFWMSVPNTTQGVVAELNIAWDSGSTFLILANYGSGMLMGEHNSGYSTPSTPIASVNAWAHYVAVFDRTAGIIKIYKNYVLTVNTTTSNTGNFGNFLLFIGQRAGSSLGFNGSLTKLKIFNYAFTPSEILTLYNSEL